ncbi:MAG TPA: hypothetical protein VHC46_10075 [Thermodesulfobacteriota bacterium]|nr:hypothetical protein [Thermodesulfobacteriota bacterium]
MEKKKIEKTEKTKAKNKPGKKTQSEKYEPPKLVKFDKLEKLIVSGE